MGVVWVDDDQRPGARRDFRGKVLEVRRPIGRLVAQIVHGAPAAQVDGGAPQGKIGRRNQHLVAVLEQALHSQHHQFGHAVADEDIVDFDAVDAELLGVLHDRLAGGIDSLRIAVSLGGRQVVDDVDQDFLGNVETERCGVADVQLHDPVAFLFEPVRLFEHRAADVVADLVQLAGLADRARWIRHVPGNVGNLEIRGGRRFH